MEHGDFHQKGPEEPNNILYNNDNNNNDNVIKLCFIIILSM